MDETRRKVINRHLDTIRAALTTTAEPTPGLLGALVGLQQECDEAIREEADRAFGRGWREGRSAGEACGWADRDELARTEALMERAKTSAVQAELDAARAQLADPVGAMQADMEALRRPQKKASTRVN